MLEAQRASLSAHCAAAVASAVAFIPGGVPTSIVTTNEDSLPGRPLYERFARAQAQETQATELVICFHGTASRNIGPISREGLDASKRGSAYGQKLGAGEYFAENLPVALQYAMRHRQLGGVNDQVLVFAVLVRLGFPHLGIPSEISDKQGSWGRIFVVADPARTLPLAVLTVPQHAEEIVLQWSRTSRVARVTSSFTPYLRQGETPRQQGEREQLEHKRKVEKMFKHLGERQLGQSAPLAVPQLGSCAFSGRPWRLWTARHSQQEAGPLGAQPLPRVLEQAASKAAQFPAFDHPGAAVDAAPRHVYEACGLHPLAQVRPFPSYHPSTSMRHAASTRSHRRARSLVITPPRLRGMRPPPARTGAPVP